MIKLKDGHDYILLIRNTKDCSNPRIPPNEQFIGNYQGSVRGSEGFWTTTLDKSKTMGFILEPDVMVIEEYEE